MNTLSSLLLFIGRYIGTKITIGTAPAPSTGEPNTIYIQIL